MRSSGKTSLGVPKVSAVWVGGTISLQYESITVWREPPNFQTMLCSSGLDTTLQKVSLREPGSSCPGQSSGDCRRAGESRSDLADALTSYVCQEPNLGDTSLLHWSFKNKEDDEQPCFVGPLLWDKTPKRFPCWDMFPTMLRYAANSCMQYSVFRLLLVVPFYHSMEILGPFFLTLETTLKVICIYRIYP